MGREADISARHRRTSRSASGRGGGRAGALSSCMQSEPNFRMGRKSGKHLYIRWLRPRRRPGGVGKRTQFFGSGRPRAGAHRRKWADGCKPRATAPNKANLRRFWGKNGGYPTKQSQFRTAGSAAGENRSVAAATPGCERELTRFTRASILNVFFARAQMPSELVPCRRERPSVLWPLGPIGGEGLRRLG